MTSARPLVTVIVTFHNQAEFVFGALDSVAAQSERNIQLIITNDGSTDDTADRINEWCALNRPDTVIVESDSNVGLPAVLNLAVPQIRGEFLVIHNGDDELYPDRIRSQLRVLLDNPEVGVVYSDMVYHDPSGRPTGERRPPAHGPKHEGDILHHFISDSFMPGGPALMVRTSLLARVGPWREDLMADDFDFILRLSEVARFKYLPIDAVLYRSLPDSLTSHVAELADGRAKALLARRGGDPETDRLIDRRVSTMSSVLHERDFDRRQTRRLLWMSLRRTRRPKCAKQLVQNYARSLASLARIPFRRSAPDPAGHAGGAFDRSRRPFEIKRRIEHLSGPMSARLALIGTTSAIGGFIEAMILVMVASVATSFTAGGSSGSLSLGPFSVLPDNPSTTLWMGFGLLLAYAANDTVTAVMSARLFSRVTRRLRRHLIESYSKAEWSAKERLEGPALVQLATVNGSKVSTAVSDLAAMVSSSLNFAVLLVTALLVDALAAGTVIVGIGVLLVVSVPLAEMSRREQANLTGLTRDYVRSIQQHSAVAREIEVFGVQTESADVIDKINVAHSDRVFRTRLLGRLNTTVYKVSSLALVLGMLAAVLAVGSGEILRFAVVALVLLRSVSYGQSAQRSWQATLEASAWLDQLETDLKPLEESRRRRPAKSRPRVDDGPMGVELEKVSFSHKPGQAVLKNVDLALTAGELVGLVGPSGAGKSTLAEIIVGLRTPQTGTVRVDGHVRRTSAATDNDRVAWVRQEPVLIRGTIIDNVRFHRPWVTNDDIRRALLAAHILDEAEAWPDGLNTDPGTLGSRISGGQKQRIAIARALAGHPRLLVLDEPTSALDATSEVAVNRTLLELKGLVTTLVIAHRAASIAGCDRILELSDGALRSTDVRPPTRCGPPRDLPCRAVGA